MKPKTIKTIIIGLPLLILAISLTQSAFTTNEETQETSSLFYFLFGSISFLGGGLNETLVWLANPLCLVTITMLLKDNKNARIFSVLSIIPAVSFRFWREILASESGSTAKIISFDTGYYLWVCNIIVLCIGTFYYFYTIKPIKKQE